MFINENVDVDLIEKHFDDDIAIRVEELGVADFERVNVIFGGKSTEYDTWKVKEAIDVFKQIVAWLESLES